MSPRRPTGPRPRPVRIYGGHPSLPALPQHPGQGSPFQPPARPGPARILPPPSEGFPHVGMPNIGVSPTVGNVLAGPSQMPAQRQLNQRSQRKELWPYTHVFPPPQATRVEPEGILAAPNPGVTSIVLQYQVPDGYQMLLTGLIQIYAGTGFTLGSTDITWLLDINTPLPTFAGGTPQTPQGYPVQQMSPSNLPKGGVLSSPACLFAPWPLPMPEPLNGLDILRSKVTTTGVIPVGAPNFFISIFLGWMWESTL